VGEAFAHPFLAVVQPLGRADEEAVEIGPQGFAGGLYADEIPPRKQGEEAGQHSRLQISGRLSPCRRFLRVEAGASGKGKPGIADPGLNQAVVGGGKIQLQASPAVGSPEIAEGIQEDPHRQFLQRLLVVAGKLVFNTAEKCLSPIAATVVENDAGGLASFIAQAGVESFQQGHGKGRQAVSSAAVEQSGVDVRADVVGRAKAVPRQDLVLQNLLQGDHGYSRSQVDKRAGMDRLGSGWNFWREGMND
jgi:hypothetical protein